MLDQSQVQHLNLCLWSMWSVWWCQISVSWLITSKYVGWCQMLDWSQVIFSCHDWSLSKMSDSVRCLIREATIIALINVRNYHFQITSKYVGWCQMLDQSQACTTLESRPRVDSISWFDHFCSRVLDMSQTMFPLLLIMINVITISYLSFHSSDVFDGVRIRIRWC